MSANCETAELSNRAIVKLYKQINKFTITRIYKLANSPIDTLIDHCKIVKPRNRVTVKLFMQFYDCTIAQINTLTYSHIITLPSK